MTSQRYTGREKRIWGEMCREDDPNNHKVISFFVKKDHGQKFDIDGTVFIPKEHLPEIILDAQKCFGMISDRLYVKGKRKQLRKAVYEELERDSYSWAALLHYLIQAYREESPKVLLSKKEWAMLQPKLTKKQERDKRLSKGFMSY